VAYSPYHNLKKGTRYPATLVVTGGHDDRVVPAHWCDLFEEGDVGEVLRAAGGLLVLDELDRTEERDQEPAESGAAEAGPRLGEIDADSYKFAAAL
jgi:hypothetical protein